MERHTRLSRAAVVLVTIALIASIAAAVWFASPDAPYVPSEDSGAALGTAAPAEDGYAEHETTVPGGYTPVRSDSDVDNMRSNGRKSNNKYILMNNIEIDSIDLTAWTGADGSPWKSELDGNGYTITINAATASGEYYDTGGLFSVIGGGAYVHDLTIVVQNVRVDNTANEGSANFGVIAGNACGAVTVDNVYIRLDKDSSGNGDAYVSSNGTTWLGGVFGKVEGSGVSIKNTTVYNAAAGSRGFSGTMVNNLGVYVGGFVGSIDKGDLTVSNIAYKADDDAKIFAVAESGAGFWESNTTLTGGVLGYHNDGSFTLDGLIFDAQVTLGSSFGTQNGDTAHAAYIVGQVDDGLSDVWSDIYINAANESNWLDGNNETRGNFIRYDAATFTDARFTDDEKIAFAVARQNPASAGSVMRTIVQENTTTTLSDAEIADIVSSGDGPAWITVDRVNATGKNRLSIGSNATAGAYNVQNYDTVSSAGDSAYRGSKVYDGSAVTTPTLNVGDATVNAWTADSTSTTADAGTKTFSYNENALSGYAAAAYNGGTYLVKDGTIYSPGTITVNGTAQTFALGKDFVYEITQAPVTVTPNVPTGDLYTGNSMPEITVTAVDSGGSPVEGKFTWDDPDAKLISGTHSYNWTWTPTSSNYQTVKGSMELEAFDRKIESLTVEGTFKTEYTAYEPFDPTGVEVIAHYSDGSQAQLVNDEYKFTVMNGDINKLIVKNDTVTVSLKKGSGASTTIKITVSKLAVDVPNAIQGLAYNGAEQIGVAASADNYYSLSDNTGTNAGDYTATATLLDEANTRWNTADPDDTTPKEIGWSIAKKDVDITVEHTSKTYDGQVVGPTTLFNAQGVNNEELALTVTVDGGKTILNAGTYSVTASLASTETNYTADPVTIDYTIETIKVSGSVAFTTSEIYDGTEKVAEFTLTSPDVLIGDDKVTITYSVEDRINVTGQAIVASVALPSSGNYQWKDGVEPTASLTIVKATPAVTVKLSDDMPGNLTVAATLDNDWLVRTDNTGVEGALTWVKAGELLQQGKVEYGWKFVPTDSNNYNNETGSLWITASEDTLQSITVDGTYKTEYTAYDDFDPTGLVVIAHYASGTKVEVTSGFTLENDKELTDGQITVTLNGVSTTITVTVNKREIPLPTATEGLIFNGKEQNGIDQKWIEQYAEFVKVDGNSQRDAGDYRATVTLTKDTKYVTWEGGSDADVSIPWTIAPMTLDGTVSAADSLEYDGNEKDAAFTVTVGELCGSDQVTFDYGAGDRINVTDGGFTATAQLPSSGNYKWAKDAPSASFVVDPKTVEIGVTADLSKTYDGNVVNPNSLFIAPQGVDGGALALTVTIDGGEEILNAGSYTVTAVLADGQTNYTAQSAQARYEIAKVVLTGTLTFAGTATYDGTAKTATFTLTSDNLVGQDRVGEVTYNDVDRIKVTGQAIVASVALPSANYQWQDGVEPTASLTIVKATPVVNPTADVQGTLYTSDDLYDIVLNLAADDTPGKVSWDEGQRLIAGEQGYNWTFVPTDEVNYNGATGVIKLTAVQAQLDSVTVDVMPNTAYTAFDAFDPTGMVVTAHYENGDTKQVAPGDLSLTVDQGSIVRLVVASTTVTVSYSDGDVTKSTTVTIEVSPLAVTAPTAVEDLVYNGAEQTGVVKSADHYTLTGNTAEDAGDYVATATLTDKANTVWSTGGTDNVTIPWTIAQMTLDGTVSADSLEYDGTQKSAQFVTSQGELFGGDEVGMQYSGDRTNVTVDGFTATAQLPSDNYKWATDAPSESFAVTPKSVVIDVTAALSKTYDGQAVDPAALFPAPDGVDGQPLELTATVDGGKTILNAGSYTVTAVLADGQTNYTAKSAQATYEIAKVVLTGTLTFAGTATYDGTAKTATFNLTSDNLVGQDKVGEVTYNDVDRINVTGQAIVASVALPSSGNYQWQDGDELTASLTIVKATPVVNPTADVQGTLYTSDDLYAIALKLGAADTPGTVSWDEGQRLIAGEQGYNWTFVPTDSVNYNGATGVIKLTAVQAALTGIRVSPSAQAEYTAYDAFDRGDIVVEAVYGDVVRAVGDYALRFSSGAEGRLVAGEITVTVSYGDGGASFEESFVIVVAKLVVEKPVVGDTTFEDNGGQITLEIAPSEFYTVTGNTGFGVGSYLATVSLVDADNTVWADGSVDDISIAWTISEPVTSDEVIADILAMEKVTWQNAEEFLDLEARYNALDESEKTAEATAKLETLKAQYDALRNAAFDDIEAAHEVTAKSLGKALAAAAAGLSAAAIALAIAKRRSI